MTTLDAPPGERIDLRSAAFADHTLMPSRYAFEHDNVPPTLEWDDVPNDTAELVLICEDLDAADGRFVHWVVAGIPPTATRLDEHTDTVRGANGSGDAAWGGPHPPVGDDMHRYAFRLYAADRPLGLGEGATADDAHAALAGHVLARGDLVGLYVR